MSDADSDWEQCTKCGKLKCDPDCTSQQNPWTLEGLWVALTDARKKSLEARAELREAKNDFEQRGKALLSLEYRMTRDEMEEPARKIGKECGIHFKSRLGIALPIVGDMRSTVGECLPIYLRKQISAGMEALWDLERILEKAAARRDGR